MITLTLVAPLLGILAIWLWGRDDRSIRRIALGTSLVPLALVLAMWIALDRSISGFQFVERYMWIPSLGIAYKVGVDGISLPMLFLTALLTTLVFAFSKSVQERARQYYALFLLLETALIGVFVALDLFLFYVAWELVLVPMYFIINIWGGPRKEYAAVKFFVYTFSGSLLMLVGLMAVYFASGLNTFDLEALSRAGSGLGHTFQVLVFFAFFVGFAVKMPVVPLHTWLPDAHVEAPTGGSVLLAGVLLKMGAYGLIRVSLPLLPEGTRTFVPVMAAIGILSILYGAFVCLAQRDLKRLVAYSSISHMGAALLGIATLTPLGMSGAVYMMFGHGLVSGLLFMVVGAIQHAVGRGVEGRRIENLGGLAQVMPKASFIFTAASLASLGLPGMVQFIAELTILLATYRVFGLLVLLPVLSVLLTAAYYLWALRRAVFGPLAGYASQVDRDVPAYEFWPMMGLVSLSVLFGVLPALVLKLVNAALASPLLAGLLEGF